MSLGKLYLIPNLISDTNTDVVIPDHVKKKATSLKHFVVENEKVARRYLKKLDRSFDIDTTKFFSMGKHADVLENSDMMTCLQSGIDVGMISDAGCPAVADPGSGIVARCHEAGIRIVPLTGPSSILLTLMASGLNGQQFHFHGYMPKERNDRHAKIKHMVRAVQSNNVTQLFMDTPYRNMNVLEDLLAICPEEMKLCISVDVTGERERVQTKAIKDWKKSKVNLAKIPVIFALGK